MNSTRINFFVDGIRYADWDGPAPGAGDKVKLFGIQFEVVDVVWVNRARPVSDDMSREVIEVDINLKHSAEGQLEALKIENAKLAKQYVDATAVIGSLEYKLKVFEEEVLRRYIAWSFETKKLRRSEHTEDSVLQLFRDYEEQKVVR